MKRLEKIMDKTKFEFGESHKSESRQEIISKISSNRCI